MKKPNEWTIRFGASRKAKDKALLAALEAEIANEERLRARQAKENPAPCVNDEERARIARAFGRSI
jgi:hypothetical protein